MGEMTNAQAPITKLLSEIRSGLVIGIWSLVICRFAFAAAGAEAVANLGDDFGQ
jgi:hypothetical protein